MRDFHGLSRYLHETAIHRFTDMIRCLSLLVHVTEGMCIDGVPGILDDDVCCPESCGSCGGTFFSISQYNRVNPFGTHNGNLAICNLWLLSKIGSIVYGLDAKIVVQCLPVGLDVEKRVGSIFLAAGCSTSHCL